MAMIMAMIHDFQLLVFVVICAVATSAASDTDSTADVSLRLYIGKSLDEYIDYSLEDADTILSNNKLNNSKPTVLYIHGYIENLEKESVKTVVQAFLERNDHNIIAVNYSKVANKFYPIAVYEAIFNVAPALVETLNKWVASGFESKKLYLVGFSLGAQVAGKIGRKVNFTISRITGLDPAGPLFYIFISHLSSFDADMVDIIHTDYGFYGRAMSTGTVDFFPNRGHRVQPGCPNFTIPLTKEDFCSHFRSWRFYSESLNDESAFLGVQCTSSYFTSDKCDNNNLIIMGYGTPRSARGNVYLVTNNQSPFGLGKQGAISS